jgi:hypothetical protein
MVTGNARVSDLAVAKVRRFCDQRVPAEARDEVAWRSRPGPPPSPSLSVDRCGKAGPVRGRACRSPNFATTPRRASGPCTGPTATDAGTATTTSTPPPARRPPPRRPPQGDRRGPSLHVLGIAPLVWDCSSQSPGSAVRRCPACTVDQGNDRAVRLDLRAFMVGAASTPISLTTPSPRRNGPLASRVAPAAAGRLWRKRGSKPGNEPASRRI